jgi:hypothetical protein
VGTIPQSYTGAECLVVVVVLFDHCTGMVTVFEVAPPMAITTGTAAPFGDAAGTSASTWYSPTEPGAKPENSTWACAPPMVTVGVVVVCESLAAAWGRSAGRLVGHWAETGAVDLDDGDASGGRVGGADQVIGRIEDGARAGA